MKTITNSNSVKPVMLTDWNRSLAQKFPHLSRPQVWGLALWSFGIVIAGSCGTTTVAFVLADLLGRKPASVKQQLREVYLEAAAKKGSSRQALDATCCFAPLLGWVLSLWSSAPQHRRLALALDATNLGQRFTVLCISVVYRSCAIPIAFKIVPGATAGKWKPHWLALLAQLEGAVPQNWQVIVLADRGLYARWLYREIVRIGWHPYLRINQQAHQLFRTHPGQEWRSLKSIVNAPGLSYAGRVELFKGSDCRLNCTLLGEWSGQHREGWLVVTDLAVSQAKVQWYGLRCWIEAGFKDLKSGGWDWQNTRMNEAARAERLWLAIALATLWTVNRGGCAEAETEAGAAQSQLERLPPTHIARRRLAAKAQGLTVAQVGERPVRQLSIFRQGCLSLNNQIRRGEGVKLGRFVPEEWPTTFALTRQAPLAA